MEPNGEVWIQRTNVLQVDKKNVLGATMKTKCAKVKK